MTTLRKAWAGTFREAAERIATGLNKYGCVAIMDSCRNHKASEPLIGFFEEAFKPEVNDGYCCWWSLEDNEPRILALLLAAEIAEREGR